jgi:hypothetical protein
MEGAGKYDVARALPATATATATDAPVVKQLPLAA